MRDLRCTTPDHPPPTLLQHVAVAINQARDPARMFTIIVQFIAANADLPDDVKAAALQNVAAEYSTIPNR